VYNEDGSIKGVATGDMGIGKNGKPTENFQRGLELHAPITLLAEGTRGTWYKYVFKIVSSRVDTYIGSLSKKLMHKFNLREGADPQTYGIGLKEVS